MNLRRVNAIAKKEIIQVWRDPRSLMIVLLMPLMQMALLGYGVNLDIKHVPICVFDREGSQQSQSLMKAFQASPYFSIVETERDYDAVKRAIDGGRCKMAVVIPPDFSQDLAATNSAAVQAILDATDDNTANIALGYAQSVVASFSGDVQLQRTQSLGQPPPVVPAVAQYRVWFNEDLVSRDFIIPGVVALVLALVGAQLTSLTISREWERGTMEVLVSTPVTRMELMAGKILPYFFIGLLDAALCLVIAVFWFEAPFRGAVFDAVPDDVAVPHRRSRPRLFHFGEHPQPGRREPGCAGVDAPADDAALRLRLSDRPDAARIQAITYLVPARYYFAILKAIFLKGSGLADLDRRSPSDPLRGHGRASCLARIPQDAGVRRCSAASAISS